MRVFVYEYLTALGVGRDPGSPEHGMFREGRAMRDALAGDFMLLPGCEVHTLDAVAEADEPGRFREEAAAADWSVVIAPEFDGLLETRCAWVTEVGGRLLGPDLDAVRLTADKLELAAHWAACGVRTPRTCPPGERLPDWGLTVLKPRFGAGSTATAICDSGEVETVLATLRGEFDGTMVAQPFVPGDPVSVAFLCGPAGDVPLVPAMQLLSTDGRFHYRGGELPLLPDNAARAVRLASAAVGSVRGLLGYVGVDLILGDDPSGAEDFTIEINPRLTTSYVGLRRLAKFNLAGAMVRVAEGQGGGAFAWGAGTVTFTPDGQASLR